MTASCWDHAQPFVLDVQVEPAMIDHYQHVNNAEYLRWIEQVSWAHSESLGLSFADYQRLDRAMVVQRHEIDYLAAAFEGETLSLATWIVACDQRFSLTRHFQLRRAADDKTLLRAQTHFACVALSSGRPRRMPEEMAKIYGAAVISL